MLIIKMVKYGIVMEQSIFDENYVGKTIRIYGRDIQVKNIFVRVNPMVASTSSITPDYHRSIKNAVQLRKELIDAGISEEHLEIRPVDDTGSKPEFGEPFTKDELKKIEIEMGLRQVNSVIDKDNFNPKETLQDTILSKTDVLSEGYKDSLDDSNITIHSSKNQHSNADYREFMVCHIGISPTGKDISIVIEKPKKL